MHRILIVEDSNEYQKVIERALGASELRFANSAEEAWSVLGAERFDLVLLDISLPKRDGYSLLGEMQSSPDLKNIPVICLTGKKGITDKVTAFSLGADDYLEKPFDPIELKIRIDARISKRAQIRTSEEVSVLGEVSIDRLGQKVEIQESGNRRTVRLTSTEFKLIAKLTSRPNQVFSRDQLLVAAWGDDARVLDRAVDVHLCSLRKKLGKMGTKIETVAGSGYRFSFDTGKAQPKKCAA